MAVPVRSAVASTRHMHHSDDYPGNGRKIYSDENVMENHVGPPFCEFSRRAGSMISKADSGLTPGFTSRPHYISRVIRSIRMSTPLSHEEIGRLSLPPVQGVGDAEHNGFQEDVPKILPAV